MDPEKQACNNLKKALEILDADRMVIGHTPQENGKILARCKGPNHHRLFVIDVAISKAYGSLGSAALEMLYYSDGSLDINAIYKNGKVRL